MCRVVQWRSVRLSGPGSLACVRQITFFYLFCSLALSWQGNAWSPLSLTVDGHWGSQRLHFAPGAIDPCYTTSAALLNARAIYTVGALAVHSPVCCGCNRRKWIQRLNLIIHFLLLQYCCDNGTPHRAGGATYDHMKNRLITHTRTVNHMSNDHCDRKQHVEIITTTNIDMYRPNHVTIISFR